MRNKKTKHFSIISINSIYFIMLIDSDVVCTFGIWYLILFILLTLLVATRLAEGRCASRSLEICCVQLGLSACAWQLCHHCHCTDGWMDGWTVLIFTVNLDHKYRRLALLQDGVAAAQPIQAALQQLLHGPCISAVLR